MPLRILFCGAFGRERHFASYYNTDHKLRNGLVRLGHQVVAIDTRATARERAPLGLKRWGAKRMRAHVLATADLLRPDLLLFGHTDLIDEATYDALRERLPHARFASFFVDTFTLGRVTVERLIARAAKMDAVFATTADREAVGRVAPRRDLFWFMPNPVDPGIETGRTDAIPAADLAYDGQFLGSEIGTRGEQIAELRRCLPAGYRFRQGGRREGGERLTGTRFVEAVRQAAACPQLPVDDKAADGMPYLYTSDRIAQTMGHGVLALTPAAGGFEAIYEDGIVSYDGRNELVEAMSALYRDDARRRAIAERGRRLVHARMNGTRVAKYMLEVTMRDSLSEDYGWPSDPIA